MMRPMNNVNDPHAWEVQGIDENVASRIIDELGHRSGSHVLECLRTAAELIRLSSTDDNLRFSESAAYNIREAFDKVVRDQPAAEGGLRTALAAWDRYKLMCDQPDADEPLARAELASALDRLTQDGQRHAFMARKLLTWFRQQTGVGPLVGGDDPTAQYQRIRDTAQSLLHSEAHVAEVSALYDDATAWFSRFFAPPSDIARRLEELAASPFNVERLTELRSLMLNSHHVRLFLQRLVDPAWLEPMQQVGLVGLPVTGEPWPVAALTADSRGVPDSVVAGLLQSMMEALASVPSEKRAAAAFEIARTACGLGQAGYPIVAELTRRFPHDHGVQVFAGAASKGLEASDPAQVVIADALIGNESRDDRGHLTRQLAARLVEGMTPANTEDRFRLLCLKIRRLAAQERFVTLGIAALTINEEDESDVLVNIACYLAQSIPKARELGLSSAAMLGAVGNNTDELEQRLICQILAGATDIGRHAKLRHLAERLSSQTATGDDRALIEGLSPLSDEEIATLTAAFGTPPQPGLDPAQTDSDSERAWRWSMLLPAAALTGWQSAVNAVTAIHGAPDIDAIDRRSPMSGVLTGSSPISRDDLEPLSPLAAAAAAAKWRPTPSDAWGVSARELARTIETLSKERPNDWFADPVAIVRSLREPVYVDHYFRALTTSVTLVADKTSEILAAIAVATTERWEPAIIGSNNFDFEEDWSGVDVSAVELIDALADADAEFGDDANDCWQLALRLVNNHPEDSDPADEYLDSERHDDPLHHAINSAHGRGLQAAIALGGWEFRRTDAASEQLTETLSAVLTIPDAAGLQLRAVIAASRPFIEAIAGEWLNEHRHTLFGDALGPVTIDQTLKYSRPTPEFLKHSPKLLLAAAHRGSSKAVEWILIGYLWEIPDYSFDEIINGLAGDARSLAKAAQQIARLSANVPPDQSHFTDRGMLFWEQLLDRAEDVPAAVLAGFGRWSLEAAMSPSRWLDLTERTVAATAGLIDFPSDVAERCRDLQPEPAGLRILAAIVGHGDQWEQYRTEEVGVEALNAAAAAGLRDDSLNHLRERLIQRGKHDASDIDLSS